MSASFIDTRDVTQFQGRKLIHQISTLIIRVLPRREIGIPTERREYLNTHKHEGEIRSRTRFLRNPFTNNKY